MNFRKNVQRINKGNCKIFNDITGGLNSSIEKVEFIKNNDPKFYKEMLTMSDINKRYNPYTKIEKYL